MSGTLSRPPATASDTRTTRSGRTDRRKRPSTPATQYGSWWWAMPALALVLCIHYIATVLGGFYAFTDWDGLGAWNWVGVANFRKIFSDPQLVVALRNTVVIALVFVVATNALGLLFALALNRMLRTRYLLRVLMFAPVVLSALAVSYIFKFVYAVDGPLNEILGAVGLESWQRTWLGDPTWALVCVLTVLVWQNVGLTMVIYLAGLATVPQEQEEAAALDGAGVLQRFRFIVLPAIQGAVAVATTLTLINGLRVFDQIMALTAGGPFGATENLSTVIFKQTFAFGRFGYGAALALTLACFIVVAAVLQLALTRTKD